MCSSSSSPAPPGKSKRRMPASSPPRSVPRTVAGAPSRASAHCLMVSWSVVVLESLSAMPGCYPPAQRAHAGSARLACAPMRLLLATHHLSSLGGSGTYVLTVAEHLERLGHEVAVFGLEMGEMAELARRRGVRVVGRTADLPSGPEALLAQDAPSALAVTARHPETPLVFVAHGATRELMLPPQLPDVAPVVVVMNERVRARVDAMARAHEVVRLRQPVDMDRFAPRRPLRLRPRRALLLGNNLHGPRYELIAEECRRAGLEVVQTGRHGEASATPETAIDAADVVVGYGRSVLEAMASGRAAYVLDHLGGDGWVTPGSFPALEADGFGGRATDVVVDRERLRADLREYDPEMGIVNRNLVVHAHDAGRHAEGLSGLLAEAAPRTAAPGALEEMSRLVRLQWQAEARAAEERLTAQWQLEDLWARVEQAEARLEGVRASARYRVGAALARPLDVLRGRR